MLPADLRPGEAEPLNEAYRSLAGGATQQALEQLFALVTRELESAACRSSRGPLGAPVGRGGRAGDPLLQAALGRWPEGGPDAAALEAFEQRRREHAAFLSHVEKPALAGGGAAGPENELLARSVEELEVSVATADAFQRLELKTLRDLVQRTEAELLKVEDFGRKSLKEVKELLADLGLFLGMRLD